LANRPPAQRRRWGAGCGTMPGGQPARGSSGAGTGTQLRGPDAGARAGTGVPGAPRLCPSHAWDLFPLRRDTRRSHAQDELPPRDRCCRGEDDGSWQTDLPSSFPARRGLCLMETGPSEGTARRAVSQQAPELTPLRSAADAPRGTRHAVGAGVLGRTANWAQRRSQWG